MAADPATLAEIARASAIVNRQKLGLPPLVPQYNTQPYYAQHQPYSTHAGPSSRARGRGRGFRATRGGHYSQNSHMHKHNNSKWVPPPAVHKNLTLQPSVAAQNDGRAAAETQSTSNTSTANDIVHTNSSTTPSSTTITALVKPSAAGHSESTPVAAAAESLAQPTAASSTQDNDNVDMEDGEISDDGKPPNATFVATQLAEETAAAAKSVAGVRRPPPPPRKRGRQAGRKSRHRQLILNQTGQQSTNADEAAGSSSGSKEIIVDGVTFLSDASGKRLIRKDLRRSDTPSTSTAGPSKTATPPKTSVNGQAYIRTKSGNLISTDYVKKRELDAKRKRLEGLVSVVKDVQKARNSGKAGFGNKSVGAAGTKTLCRYFQRTGICTRGLTCPYLHDDSKVAICPRFLRQKCTLTSSSCPLSHEPNPHRMPHCVHFPSCRNGTDCIYPHVHVSPTAKVCRDFVTIGWCDKGTDCRERHVWECPEFSDKGTCSTKGCKLPHIIRRSAAGPSALDDEEASTMAVPPLQVLPDLDDPSDLEVEDALLTKPTRKRSIDTASAASDAEDATMMADADKAKKPRFDPLRTNDDFITLILSDSDNDASDDDDDSSSASESEVESEVEAAADALDDNVDVKSLYGQSSAASEAEEEDHTLKIE